MQKSVLDEMSMSVEVLVIASLLLSVLTRRNHGNHALSGGLFDDGIAVVTLVGQQVFGTESFN